jgi:L-arabinonolactonase
VQINRVPTIRCNGGEGPLWDTAEQALYFIDNFGQKLHRYDPASARTQTWDMPSVITSVALRKDGGAVVTLWTGIFFLNFESGQLQELLPLSEGSIFAFNDCKVDRRGRLMIGGCTRRLMDPQPDGGLFRLDPDHRLTQIDHGVHFSNGPCWAPDNKTFYFADSFYNRHYAYDYDIETGSIANKRPFADTGGLGGLPDGATVDSDGLLWVAVYGGGKIAAFRPDGKLERVVEMPVKMVSSVMFGGANLDQLYVVTIEKDARGAPTEKGAGEVYVIEDLGVRGLPETRYAG